MYTRTCVCVCLCCAVVNEINRISSTRLKILFLSAIDFPEEKLRQNIYIYIFPIRFTERIKKCVCLFFYYHFITGFPSTFPPLSRMLLCSGCCCLFFCCLSTFYVDYLRFVNKRIEIYTRTFKNVGAIERVCSCQ